MPGCYWIGIYLDPKKISIEEMIHKTTESLLESGCTFYKVTETKPKKEMVDVPQQSYNLNDLNVDLEESINIATKTFKEIKDKHGTSISKYPGIWFTFLFDFKVDEQSRKEFEAEYPHRRINAIEFHFCFHKDEIFKTRYEICLFTEWDGIVDYGIEEFNRYNKAKIMDIVRNIYDKLNPFYIWMDEETGSTDVSYKPLAEGDFPDGNEYVFVGKKLVDRIDEGLLEKNKGRWEKLPDGGILIKGYEIPLTFREA